MGDIEKLKENFEFIGQNVGEDVIAKCVEMCKAYDISEEDLINQWLAFSITSLNGNDASVEGLETMERRTKMSKSKSLTPSTPVLSNKKPTIEKPLTPTTPRIATEQVENLSIKDILSPKTIEIVPYSDRNNPGKVVLTYGTDRNYTPCFHKVKIEQLHEQFPVDVKYMFETMRNKKLCLSKMTTDLAYCIARTYGLELPESQEKFFDNEYIYGRIMCDGDGKLNADSVLLELPFAEISYGNVIRLNLKQVTDCSIFPGQVAVVKGKCIKGNMIVEKIFTKATLQSSYDIKLDEPLQIIVASGPFTINIDLTYDPLQDLLKYVLETRPHVLILTGPFLSEDNDHVQGNLIHESFNSFFHSLVESIMNPLLETDIQVIFVSSFKDAHHHVIYPTPPYDIKQKYSNLLCVSDPSTININGVCIAITATDVLFQLAKHEFSNLSKAGDRMKRLCELILGQLSFYPVYPPEESISIDYHLLDKFGLMETYPHILILPSNFKHFVKESNGCTIINPERLVKGYSSGTFARLNVTYKSKLNVSCDIIRI